MSIIIYFLVWFANRNFWVLKKAKLRKAKVNLATTGFLNFLLFFLTNVTTSFYLIWSHYNATKEGKISLVFSQAVKSEVVDAMYV